MVIYRAHIIYQHTLCNLFTHLYLQLCCSIYICIDKAVIAMKRN
jgi:hypothetical protein